MEIKLYYNIYPGIAREELKIINITLNGKMGLYFEKFSANELLESPPETRRFECEYNNDYKKEFNNLNYRFKFFHNHCDDDSFLGGKEGYAHLNSWEKIKIEWLFKRSWFQQKENIKWLISIPISILTAWITSYLCNF
ncbi:MAG: hypothetical protein PHR00_00970 [Patescibacteria group bacterium]|nr:hypothetical protein [Patescibacteria group bacterium]